MEGTLDFLPFWHFVKLFIIACDFLRIAGMVQEYDVYHIQSRVDSMLQVLGVLPRDSPESDHPSAPKLYESLHEIKMRLLKGLTPESMPTVAQQLELASGIFQMVINGEEYERFKEMCPAAELGQSYYWLPDKKAVLKEADDLAEYAETLYDSGDETFGEDQKDPSSSKTTLNWEYLYAFNQLNLGGGRQGDISEEQANKNANWTSGDVSKRRVKRKQSFEEESIARGSGRQQLKGKGKRRCINTRILE